MITKKLIPALLIMTVLAASVSTSAFAHERGGNNGLAIAAGIIGAVAVGSLIANATSAAAYAPPPVYRPAPQQVYYQPAPVYVRPAPVYVAPQYRERPVYRVVQRPYYNGYYYGR